MNTLRDPKAGQTPYTAHSSLRSVHFYCHAPGARSVRIAGDFNHWSPVPMERRLDGWWYLSVLVCHGHHRYRFLVDGEARLDETATGVGRDDDGNPVSLVAVS